MKFAIPFVLSLFAVPQAPPSQLAHLPILGSTIRLLDTSTPRETLKVIARDGEWVACELSTESAAEVALNKDMLSQVHDVYNLPSVHTHGDFLLWSKKEAADIAHWKATHLQMAEVVADCDRRSQALSPLAEATSAEVARITQSIVADTHARPYWINLSAVAGYRVVE